MSEVRVLVVDDDPWILRMVSSSLQKRNFIVETARDGKQALERAIAAPPSLIITDVMMPVMDGWTFVQHLRSDASLSRIPVLFLTALGKDEGRLAQLGIKEEDYIPKPFRFDDLERRVSAALAKAESNQAMPASPQTPPPGAYPQGGYPGQQPGYPGQPPGGYPPPQPGQGGYPPPQPGGYPGYPPQQPGGYPQPGPPGYPQGYPGYPQQPPGQGYPQQPPGYPGGYPQQPPGGYPGYPPQQPGQGYPQQPPGYPQQPPPQPTATPPTHPAPDPAASGTFSNKRSSGLSGRLEQLGLSSLLVMMEMERKDGVLRLQDDEGTDGRIFIRQGQCIQAKLDQQANLEDKQCVYEMLRWQKGKFSFSAMDVDMENKIQSSTTGLLMEGARLIDEDNR